MNGTGYLPVTGGLFLGDEVAASLNARNSFPVTQDQRNTVRTRFRYDFTHRVWGAAGAEYGSGLPVEFPGTREDALAEYGPRIVDRVNFSRGRVRPNFSFDISAGADLWKVDRRGLRLQADVLNLTNRLNVIDFAGLFSGTALGAPRTVAVRLEADF
jgi:outer membrane receptor for Fe3+-dicitrate